MDKNPHLGSEVTICSICHIYFDPETEGGIEFVIGTFITGALCSICENGLAQYYCDNYEGCNE
jgi:hypothetical protein